MKIVHISPNAVYNDYWGYQDNMLPKYHVKAGHQVWILLRNVTYEGVRIVECPCGEHQLNDGVIVKRFQRKEYPCRVLSNLLSHIDVYETLCSIKPDFIFFHGLQSISIFDAIRYKKTCNPKCRIVQDNHVDYYNAGKISSWKNYIIRSYYRLLNAFSQRHVEKVYGVTPWRKTYAEDYYCISSQKTDVLIMGADDEKIVLTQRDTIRQNIRQQYDIEDDDFLVVTGGKIDVKKNIHVLAKAIENMNKVKLLVFGSVHDSFRDEFMQSLGSNVLYIGWVRADSVYDYFFAADLVCFPGSHSVLWEQACATKVPCLFKHWEGMEHVNNGGNAAFIDSVTVENLREAISQLHYTEEFKKMKQIANSEKTDVYLYSNIAEKSLEHSYPQS